MIRETTRCREREELVATLERVGPHAPTLCSEWTAEDIAGHLVVSEAYRGWPLVFFYGLRRVMPPRLTQRSVRSMQAVGTPLIRRAKGRGWPWLMSRIASGPPEAYFRPGGISALRLTEEWVHHEDLRRANGLGPRLISAELNEALWQAALVLTRFPDFLPGRDGVEVALPDGRIHQLGAVPKVRVEGEPGEVLLYLAGRTEASEVAVTGDASAIQALRLAV